MTKIKETIILTTMTMVYNDKGEMLVVNRTKNDWPGLNFPGGHVELGEDITASAIREVKEETGLSVSNLKCMGYYSWTSYGINRRDLVILFRTNTYKGTLTSSNEGEVFFVPINNYKNFKLSADFDDIVSIMTVGLNE
ncbi:MAG: NUDIX domain-containing protein [Erysipelotrichaceae bacterium]|nr:NUDIX domain-containing protein [Erysipelotrichaceae bacterium]